MSLADQINQDAERPSGRFVKLADTGDKIDLNHSGAVKFERIECVVVDPAG